ncbi:hypothetical protein O3P69_011882 [Scylla paramamosain]|uniref:Uncharacterized protein n=1 Tax=Scylla paramamosain TaxID=85552 RepID=A0AAW0S9M5_SCYPA
MCSTQDITNAARSHHQQHMDNMRHHKHKHLRTTNTCSTRDITDTNAHSDNYPYPLFSKTTMRRHILVRATWNLSSKMFKHCLCSRDFILLIFAVCLLYICMQLLETTRDIKSSLRIATASDNSVANIFSIPLTLTLRYFLLRCVVMSGVALTLP